MVIDRTGLAEFLRRRRESLQPEDVGLPRGQRRRTSGLRREEVAALCHMSTDYYSRLERERGPQPSEQMIASIAQGLHLSLDERDHLFRLAGHNPPHPRRGQRAHQPRAAAHLRPPARHPRGDRHRARRDAAADPARRRAHRRPDRATPARPAASATDGSPTRATRQLYAPEDHAFLTRMFASGLREVVTLRGPGSRAAHLADLLLARSEEFRQVWDDHEVGIRPNEVKHFVHPEVGALELTCQTLLDPSQSHCAARLHRRSRQRELREVAAAVRHRRADASLRTRTPTAGTVSVGALRV